MTEFALVVPLFTMVLVGIVVLGFGLFIQQEVTNAAREGARYAVLHSATSQCPTVSNLAPNLGLLSVPNQYFACDAPANRWPRLTDATRAKLFGVERPALRVTACWSGYWSKDTSGNWASYDLPPKSPNQFRQCSVPVYGWTPSQNRDQVASALHTINPRNGLDTSSGVAITIDCSRDFPVTAAANDMASNFASSSGATAGQVTVLSCYPWHPPLAGFLLIPRNLTITGVISEALEYQQ